MSRTFRSNGKYWAVCLILPLIATICAAQVQASDPPSILSIFKRKPAGGDANSLELKAEHGPWLILAATFAGPDAQNKAVTLANEIRSGLKLPSFVFKKSFDHTQDLGSVEKLVDEVNGDRTLFKARKRYANGSNEITYAVLVAEFPSSDDPHIEKTLNRVKYAKPASLVKPGTEPAETSESTNWLVQKARTMVRSRSERNDGKGPMASAILTRNPLLPSEFFAAPIDDFVVKLNKQVDHSLLDNPGRFTVRVASFYGYASTQLVSAKLGSKANNSTTDALDHAAAQADKLTQALRKRGVEAYQYHDRVGSYVAVGSFNELGTKLQGGGFNYNPAMLAVLKKYCGYRTVTARNPQTGAVSNTSSVNSLEKIPFDIEGKPMAVPRPKASKLYMNQLLGGR